MFLQGYNIRHMKARVKHPQSNVKVERADQMLQRLWKHFQCWDATVEYYNFKRPHSLLENVCLGAPFQAFFDKTRVNGKKTG